MSATNSLPAGAAGSRSGYTKGRVLLRDSLVFLSLCGISVALFGVTLFLFRSFAEHRQDLGRDWASRGRTDLAAGRPADAVAALRTSLSFLPDDRANQLLLAEALAASGRTDEATNYFLNLWDAEPGNGFVNLQLARLERGRGYVPEAVNYYRAAITGSWEGDGTVRRRETRLELADYFAGRKDFGAARAELLIAVGNAPAEEDLETLLGDRLQAVGDLPSALQLYQKALQSDPHRWNLLQKAGRLAYELGQYAQAEKLLSTAASEPAAEGTQQSEDGPLRVQAEKARRIAQLSLAEELPADVLADHIVADAKISERRLRDCAVQLNLAKGVSGERAGAQRRDPAGELPPELALLRDRGAAAATVVTLRELQRDANLRNGMVQLVEDTETETAQVCGAPTGDDALLLMLAGRERPGRRP